MTMRAEDGVVADDCKMVIKEISLLHSHASNVKVCAEAFFGSLLLLKVVSISPRNMSHSSSWRAMGRDPGSLSLNP